MRTNVKWHLLLLDTERIFINLCCSHLKKDGKSDRKNSASPAHHAQIQCTFSFTSSLVYTATNHPIRTRLPHFNHILTPGIVLDYYSRRNFLCCYLINQTGGASLSTYTYRLRVRSEHRKRGWHVRVAPQKGGTVNMRCRVEDILDGLILTAKKLPLATGWTTIVSTEAV